MTGRKVSYHIAGATNESPGEQRLHYQLHVAGMPEHVREYRFHEPGPGEKRRNWRFDFAWPQMRLAVEVEGGTWVNGRHNRGAGFEDDCQKYNQAALQGWFVLRFTTEMVENGVALSVIQKAIEKYR